jgi:hypothetical protein
MGEPESVEALQEKKRRLQAELKEVYARLKELKQGRRASWGLRRRRSIYFGLRALRLLRSGHPPEAIAAWLGVSESAKPISKRTKALAYARTGKEYWAARHEKTTSYAAYDKSGLWRIKPLTKAEHERGEDEL